MSSNQPFSANTPQERLWPGQISCSGHAPSCLLVPLLTGTARETEKSLTWAKHCSAQPTHQCVISIIPLLNPKHSTVAAARKKINSIPDGTGTLAQEKSMVLCCWASPVVLELTQNTDLLCLKAVSAFPSNSLSALWPVK